MTRKVELFRLLENNIWDTIVIEIPSNTPEPMVKPFVEKMIENDLMRQAQHRKAILMGIYNFDVNADERTEDECDADAEEDMDRRRGLYGPEYLGETF